MIATGSFGKELVSLLQRHVIGYDRLYSGALKKSWQSDDMLATHF